MDPSNTGAESLSEVAECWYVVSVMQNRAHHISWFLALLLCASFVQALEVRLVGDRVWLHAKEDPLVEVLRGFAHAGVRVRLDPEIEATVRGNVKDEPVESVLKRVLEPFGYVLLWDVIDGPIGRYPKLAEIQVFKPGQQDKMRQLAGVDDNFVVATGPDGRGPRFVADELLIGFRVGTRRDDFERLIREIGGSVVDSVPGVGVYLVRLPLGSNILDLVAQLKRNPLIAHVEPNYISEMGVPRRAAETAGSAPMGMPPAPVKKGAVPVAVLDSGIRSLQGLSDMVLGTYDAVNPDREPDDRLGHGTQMAMIAAGLVSPHTCAADGPETGVPVLAIRAFDDNGNASTYSLMRSVSYAMEKGARVLNMSWGSDTSSEFLEAAIRYAQKKGAVVVAAAGNRPTGQPVYPAAYSGVVAVSALDADGGLWSQSNTGNFITFAAPGTASFPVGYQGPPGAYAGTSISSAFVARSLALYFENNPQATANDAVSALTSAVQVGGATGRDPRFGYGAVNASAVSRLLR